MDVRLEFATKSFGRSRVLDAISVAFGPGELIAVLGPNGAGKTTLLRVIAGILALDRGRVLLDGEVFTRARLHFRHHIATLPDFPVFYPHFTVAEHIAMVIRVYHKSRDDIAAEVVALLDEFGILDQIDAPMQTLSRGQLYKAALIALLVTEPRLLLFDEPFASGMDPAGLAAFRVHVRAATARGATVIYTTQIEELVEAFADRVCVIDRGRVHAIGPPNALAVPGTEGNESLAGILGRLSRRAP